jgi:Glycosyltransferase family 87
MSTLSESLPAHTRGNNSKSNATRPLPPELRLFCNVTLWATAATWLIVFVASKIGLPYPYNWFMVPVDVLHDYWGYFERFRLLHTTTFFTAPGHPFTYLAPTVPLYKFLYIFGEQGGFLVYMILIIVALSFAFMRIRSEMLLRGFHKELAEGLPLLILVASYPLIFCIQRGNLEILIAIGLAFGTWAYWKGWTWTAAIVWGVFGSVKLYPLLLLVVFFSFRQYRQFFVSLLAAATTTLLSLLYIGPDLRTASAGISGSLDAFLNIYSLGIDYWIGFDHSLFALLKLNIHNLALPSLLRGYMLILAIVMSTLYFVRIHKLPVANQLLILTVASILLPPTSFDYTLLHLYAPFLILVFVTIDSSQRISGLFPVFALLGLIFTPTNFFFYSGHGASGQIKCVLLLGLMTMALIYPFSFESASAVLEAELIAAG